MSTFVNMVMTLAAIGGSSIASLPRYINYLNVLYLCVCAAFYLLSRVWHKTYPKLYLAMTQAFLSVIWFANGGLKGSVPYFFFVLLFVALIVCKLKPVVTAFLVVGNFLLLIVIEFFHQEWVVLYPDEATHFLDIAASVPMVLILLAYWISMLKTQYDDERFVDPLTGLNNRKRTLGLLEQMMRQERENPDLSVAFFDVDHFKKLNDTYGHSMGDQVLKRIGGVLRDSLRESDIAGRYGGEEFLVALPHTAKEDALKIMERIRHRVSEIQFVSGSESARTSISIGLVSLKEDEAHISMLLGQYNLLARIFPPRSFPVDKTQVDGLKDRVVSEMIQIADDRMYRAKMSECRECGYPSNFALGIQNEVCPECGGSAWVLGRNRTVTV